MCFAGDVKIDFILESKEHLQGSLLLLALSRSVFASTCGVQQT